jgi:hypothetical protein
LHPLATNSKFQVVAPVLPLINQVKAGAQLLHHVYQRLQFGAV